MVFRANDGFFRSYFASANPPTVATKTVFVAEWWCLFFILVLVEYFYMAKIIQKYKDCIGCGACVAVCPKFWEMDDDMKARPKNGKKSEKTMDYQFEIDEKDLDCNKEAVDVCPVDVIEIINE